MWYVADEKSEGGGDRLLVDGQDLHTRHARLFPFTHSFFELILSPLGKKEKRQGPGSDFLNFFEKSANNGIRCDSYEDFLIIAALQSVSDSSGGSPVKF